MNMLSKNQWASCGTTTNVRNFQDWKVTDWKLADWKMTDRKMPYYTNTVYITLPRIHSATSLVIALVYTE